MNWAAAVKGQVSRGKAPASASRAGGASASASRAGGASASASQGWKIVELEFENKQLRSNLEESEARAKSVEEQLEQCKAQLEAIRWKLAVRTQQCEDNSARLRTIKNLRPSKDRVVCIRAGEEIRFMLSEKRARDAIVFEAFNAWDFNYCLPEYETIFHPGTGNVKAYDPNDFIGEYYVFQIGGQPQKMKIVEIDYDSNFYLKCFDENGDDMIIPLSEARFKEFKE